MDIEQLERMASLVGEPARIKILWALMDGKAYTATELAVAADVSAQSASMHLGKLVNADLLKVIAQGRHRYYSYARDEVAYAVEAMANLIPRPELIKDRKTADSPFRYCRSCYDHLAGKVGVAITERLLKLDYLEEKGSIYDVTSKGNIFFNDLGIATVVLSKQQRPLARPCLDWSERRFHLAGSIGFEMLNKMMDNHWIRRVTDSRTLMVTSIGKSKLYDIIGLEV